MGTAAVKIKLMPSSPETDLEKIKDKVSDLISAEEKTNIRFEIEPIAFGLKALIIVFGWPEEKSLDELQAQFEKIENVNSVELIDIRRAVG